MKDWSCQQNMEWTPQKFIGTNHEQAWMPSRVTRSRREIWMMGLIQYMNLDDIASRATSYEKFQEIQGVRVMIDRRPGSSRCVQMKGIHPADRHLQDDTSS